jgi:hypothetical protein
VFTEREIKFLIQPHKMETADRGGSRTLFAAHDLRELGCPASIFNRVLEGRARKLGPKFAEFRKQQYREQPQGTPASDLDAQIAAAKLW